MDDDKIISLYWQRDEKAIAETQKKYGRFCYSIAYGLLKSKEDAEECENDTYLAAWNAIPPAKPQSLSAFLGRITRNLALKCYARRTAQKRGGETADLVCELREIATADTVEEAFDTTHTAALIDRFVAEETEEHRRMFVRRYWYGDPLDKVAAAVGCSESTVKVRLHRQRERLRTYLQKEGISV